MTMTLDMLFMSFVIHENDNKNIHVGGNPKRVSL